MLRVGEFEAALLRVETLEAAVEVEALELVVLRGEKLRVVSPESLRGNPFVTVLVPAKSIETSTARYRLVRMSRLALRVVSEPALLVSSL